MTPELIRSIYDAARMPVGETQDYPAPEITSRDNVPFRHKEAVTDLLQLAGACGWDAVVTYARGCFPHATLGTPGPVKKSLAVRLRRGQERAVAVYAGDSKWAWGTLVRWIEGGRATWSAGITEFQDAVFGPAHLPARPFRVVAWVPFFRVPCDAGVEYGPEREEAS